MTTERYTLDDLDADELSAILAHRAAKQIAPPPRKRRAPFAERYAMRGALALVVVMLILGGFKVAEYVMAYAAAFAPQPTAAPLPTAIVNVPAAPPRPVVVPASVPQAPVAPQPAVVEAPAPVVEPVHVDAQPDLVAVNTDRAMGGTGDTSPLPAVLPTVVPGPVAPYDASDPAAVATWNQALRNSGVDVDATATVMAEIACNADLAAGGAGCQP